MITPISIVSVLPETHVVAGFDSSGCMLSRRIEQKSKAYISLRDDESHLEWRVTKCHEQLSNSTSSVSEWMSTQGFNVTFFCTVSGKGPVLTKPQLAIIESICGPFVVGKSTGAMCASAWRIDGLKMHDILCRETDHMQGSDEDGEFVPETDSVRIRTPLDLQRFLRRLEHSVEADSVAFVRMVLFDENRIVHFVFAKDNDAVKMLSVIPQARMARKSGSPFAHLLKGLSERCLSPLLAGNAKPFIIIDAAEVSDSNVLTYQTLFDIGEKMCITALPCESELNLQIEDFEIIDSMDKLPPFRPVDRKSVNADRNPRVSVHLDEVSRPKSASKTRQEEDVLTTKDPMIEVDELRAKNLTLRCELDRLAAAALPSNEGGNAYTNHLVAEVKQLRSELLNLETEKRKYETSKRLIDSLIEKSNKLKTESACRASKLDEFGKRESLLKTELTELKRNCEVLLQENRSLNLELDRVKLDQSSTGPRSGGGTVESFYHEFLFPFNRKRDLGKTLVGINEALQKIERTVAINAPSAVLDVRRCIGGVDKVKEMTNELIAASEKLEISSATLIKKLSHQ